MKEKGLLPFPVPALSALGARLCPSAQVLIPSPPANYHLSSPAPRLFINSSFNQGRFPHREPMCNPSSGCKWVPQIYFGPWQGGPRGLLLQQSPVADERRLRKLARLVGGGEGARAA